MTYCPRQLSPEPEFWFIPCHYLPSPAPTIDYFQLFHSRNGKCKVVRGTLSSSWGRMHTLSSSTSSSYEVGWRQVAVGANRATDGPRTRCLLSCSLCYKLDWRVKEGVEGRRWAGLLGLLLRCHSTICRVLEDFRINFITSKQAKMQMIPFFYFLKSREWLP